MVGRKAAQAVAKPIVRYYNYILTNGASIQLPIATKANQTRVATTVSARMGQRGSIPRRSRLAATQEKQAHQPFRGCRDQLRHSWESCGGA